MPELVADCPRCDAQRITFDVHASHIYKEEYGWQLWYEACSLCRHCGRYTVFFLADSPDTDWNRLHKIGVMNVEGSLNDHVRLEGYVSRKDEATVGAPEHVPEPIAAIFREGAMCQAVQCHNAACAMYRLCIDLTTKSLLPAEATPNGPNHNQRNRLADRLTWLFDHGHLARSLEELAGCIRQDGNDAAHDGTVGDDEAADLQDFTVHLLENVYTAPERLRLARARRDARRGSPGEQR